MVSCSWSWGLSSVAALLAAVADPAQAALTNVTSLCSPHATPPAVLKGSTAYVCINLNDQYRTVFTPVADQFTVLRLADSWNDTRVGGYGDGAYITVSSGEFRTNYKLYASAKGNVYPYMTAIISVKKGVVQGVSWDDGCYFCNSDTCEPNLYRYPTNVSSQLVGEGYTCYDNMANKCVGENATSCDLTVYVGWTGTDSKGNYLSSAGLRMSQFKKYSIGSYFKNIASAFSNLIPSSRFDN